MQSPDAPILAELEVSTIESRSIYVESRPSQWLSDPKGTRTFSKS
jgi:hypothetical protein